MWPFTKRELKCCGVRPVGPIPEPPPPESWDEERLKVGNCPRCGAPVYEDVEVKCETHQTITRLKEPSVIVYTCDCKALMDNHDQGRNASPNTPSDGSPDPLHQQLTRARELLYAADQIICHVIDDVPASKREGCYLTAKRIQGFLDRHAAH